jgi:glycosyltransferase involved in cell wall biosynthesis
MLLLHLIGSFSQQELYKNLIEKLQGFRYHQKVYVPVRSYAELGKNSLPESSDLSIYYSFILRKYHRILFFLKITDVYSDLKKKIDLNNIELIHCHTLFSEGAVALKLKRQYNTPYIVAVRNTDVNVFFKYMFHLRSKGVEILLNANHIVFITPSYVDEVLNKYIPINFRDDIKNKISIIPNGLNQYWLKNKSEKIIKKGEILKILYIGDFTPNKNISSVIKAVEQLKKEGVNISLTLVGGGGLNSSKILKQLNRCDKNVIKFHKRTESKEELLTFYKENDIFVMPSLKETFGIVYLEAMSQGLPIIFSQGQGVDGYFKENSPGYSVNPHSVEDIKNKIILASENIEELSTNSLKHIDAFSWDIISKRYDELYRGINLKIWAPSPKVCK